jgi:alpha-tubulin suppressor-like RCC1 family protein
VGAAPALALTSLAGGYVHACGLRNGAVHCWGRASTVAVKPPTGVFGLIAAGDDETCAVFSRGDEVTCWRKDGTIESRMGEYVELALGQGFACGLRGSGLVDCWGAAPAGLPSEPLHGITAGMSFACGVREDGRATCWGTNKQGGSLVPPSGARFVQLAAGFRHVCGLDHTGSARCWGGNADGMAQPPAGPFTQLAAGNDHTCGLRVDGRVLCWGSIDAAPTLAFRQIVAGKDYVCGVR